MITDFKGKTTLVTGASSGIGKVMAEELAARGSHLVITARSADILKAMAKGLASKYGVKVLPLAIDLTQAAAPKKLFEAVKKAKVDVDILVNNAGYGKWGDFLSIKPEDNTGMVQLNVQSLVALTHLFLPAMVKRKEGGILNVGSTAALVPVPYSSVYAATKWFVLGFTDSLRGEVGPLGIQVMTLCPGATESNFAKVANPSLKTKPIAFDPPELVVKTGLKAFLAGKGHVVVGSQKWSVLIAPRFLPRQVVINIVGNMWKKMAGK